MDYSRLLVALASLPFVIGMSCVSSSDALEVNVLHLKDLTPVKQDNSLVRSEQQKRLYGAVDLESRRERLGLYFTACWELPELAVTEPVKVVLHYRQAATGAKVYKKGHQHDVLGSKGVCEFSIVGDEYNSGGRILSWKMEVFSASKLLAEEQSYLWE